MHWAWAWGRMDSPLPQGGGLIVDGHDGMPKGWLAVGGAAQESTTLRRCSLCISSKSSHASGQVSFQCSASVACSALREHKKVRRQMPCERQRGWAEVLTMGAGQH